MDFNDMPLLKICTAEVCKICMLLYSMIYSTCIVLDFGSFTLWHALLHTLTLKVFFLSLAVGFFTKQNLGFWVVWAKWAFWIVVAEKKSHVGEFASITTAIWNFLQSTNKKKIIVVQTTIFRNTTFWVALALV